MSKLSTFAELALKLISIGESAIKGLKDAKLTRALKKLLKRKKKMADAVTDGDPDAFNDQLHKR